MGTPSCSCYLIDVKSYLGTTDRLGDICAYTTPIHTFTKTQAIFDTALCGLCQLVYPHWAQEDTESVTVSFHRVGKTGQRPSHVSLELAVLKQNAHQPRFVGRWVPLGDDAHLINRRLDNLSRAVQSDHTSFSHVRRWLTMCENEHTLCKSVEHDIKRQAPNAYAKTIGQCRKDVRRGRSFPKCSLLGFILRLG